MQENILVCISNGKNTKKLMTRAKKISDAFRGNCIALNILNEEIDEFDFEQEQSRQEFKKLASDLGIEFLQVSSTKGKIAEAMVKVIKEKNVTQLILGQPARTKWEVIMKGSIINELFQLVDGVDIHIVEVNREVFIKEERFHRGVEASLVKMGDDYQIVLESKEEAVYKGVYFQHTDTEFTNGIFKIQKDGFYILKVYDGKVNKQEIEKLKK